MHLSPRDRRVGPLAGEPDVIISRGERIEEIGQKMRESSQVLGDIANRAMDQQGKAVESLVEVIGDSHTTLSQAADLYEPVGPAITMYGRSIDIIQPIINDCASKCEDLWERYQSMEGDKDGRGVGGFGEPEAGSEEAEEQAEQDEAKRRAYEEWKEEADSFDFYYDRWDDVFDSALSQITHGLTEGIEDSGWDSFKQFLDFTGEALGWIGMGLGVAGIFFPPLLPFAAIAGGASFLITGAQATYGDATWGEVGLSALGMIPFGKVGAKVGGKVLGKSMKSADETKLSDEFINQFKPGSTKGQPGLVKDIKNEGVVDGGLSKLVTGDTASGAAGKSTPEVIGNAADTTLRNKGWIDQVTPPSNEDVPDWTNRCVAPGAPPPPVQIPEATPSPTPQPSPAPTPVPTVVPEP